MFKLIYPRQVLITNMDIKEMKIVKHFSHNHPLSPSKLQENKEEEELICSICEVSLSSSSLGCASSDQSSDQNHYYYYKCTKPNCDFLLHKSCFELPEQIHDHKSHPSHTLTLHFPSSSSSSSSSSNDDDYHLFFCEACGLHGSAFRYQCKSCQFDVHVGCASLTQMVECKNHQHPLTLLYGYPNDKEGDYGGFLFCDVCNGIMVSRSNWMYYCQECDYGTHLDCAKEGTNDDDDEEEESHEEEECKNDETVEALEEIAYEEEVEDDDDDDAFGNPKEVEASEGKQEEEEEEANDEEEAEEELEASEKEEEEGNEEGRDDEEYLNSLILQNQVLSNGLYNMQHRQRMRMMKQMGPPRMNFHFNL